MVKADELATCFDACAVRVFRLVELLSATVAALSLTVAVVVVVVVTAAAAVVDLVLR